MTRPQWFDELDALAARFAHTGVSADLGALSIMETWLLLAYLRRLAETSTGS